MKRWLFNAAAAVSLSLSLAAATSWATSYGRPVEWRLLAIAHSAELRRVDVGARATVSMMPVNGSDVPPYGFWDGWWALSQSGRVRLLAHNVDYDGAVRRVYASPPSLTVEVSTLPGGRAVAFARTPDSSTWVRRLGFAWDVDAQHADEGQRGSRDPVSARATMIMLPHWFVVAIGVPTPLLWLRVKRRSAARAGGDENVD